MIVTVTPTIMDGAVVRWYVNETAFECGAEKVSASRNGVIVSGYLHEVPPDVLDAAQTVYVNLRRDPRADVSRYATHSRRGLFGQLEPVPSPFPFYRKRDTAAMICSDCGNGRHESCPGGTRCDCAHRTDRRPAPAEPVEEADRG